MSNEVNERALEHYYEQFLDQGHTREESARLAKIMFENLADTGYEKELVGTDYYEEVD